MAGSQPSFTENSKREHDAEPEVGQRDEDRGDVEGELVRPSPGAEPAGDADEAGEGEREYEGDRGELQRHRQGVEDGGRATLARSPRVDVVEVRRRRSPRHWPGGQRTGRDRRAPPRAM